MRESRTPTDRRTPRCRWCGMPAPKPTIYSRAVDLRDQLLRGAYCDADCLLGAFDAHARYAGRAALVLEGPI